MLLRAARRVAECGHEIAFVHSCRPEAHYDAGQSEFERLASEMGVPFLAQARAGDAVAAWLDTGAEVAISVNWPTLIGRAALDALPHGILNAHAGDLPRYRGNACPNWAILNHERSVGLTIHQMSSELDAGPWLYKSWFAIDETTYVADIYAWMEDETPRAFVEALARIAALGPEAQDQRVRPLRTFPRRPSDARIDWSACTRTTMALIRASSRPFDGAFTMLEGVDIVRIFRARPHVPEYEFCAAPGQVCFRLGEDPVIATGDGMIAIEDCRSEGRDCAETKALVAASLRNRLI
jgi:methionyl-tRNA formyltransferase